MDLKIGKLRVMFPRSLLAEFTEIFGEANARKLIDVFSGTTLEIPSRKALENAERDMLIYELLSISTSPQQGKEKRDKLSRKYNLSKGRVQEIFRQMKRQVKENRKFQQADESVGRLQRSRIKVEHRSRRKM